MSWSSKVGLSLVIIASSAMAQRIDFSGEGTTSARLQTKLLSANGAVAPIEIQLAVPSIDVNRGSDGFQQVQVEGLTPMGIAGNPDLLATGSLIAVPEGYAPQITVTNNQEQIVDDVMVRPTQREFRCETPAANQFHFNRALYSSNEVYPASPVALEEVGSLQGLHLMRVALHPLRMEMAAKRLHVTTNLVVNVTFTQIGNAAPVTLSRPFYSMVRSVAANGRGLGHAVRAAGGPDTLIIVVADDLKDSVAKLVDWKRAKGMNVEVVTSSQAGGTREAIKTYLQNYYTGHEAKPSYFLFVGNKDGVATYSEDTASGPAATDYPYSLLTRKDAVPDVLYGRLVANDASEVATQIDRWIAYEKTPEKGATWYSDGMTIASNQGSGPSDKEYAQQIQAALKGHTYKNMDSFFQGEKTATSKNISGALEKGRSWIAYFGHGSGTSWGSTNDTFDNGAVDRLKNDNRLPIVVDVACLNASWVDLDRPFGKAWVTKVNGGKAAGAVAFLGGSVSISWHPPAVMSVGVAKYHFEKPVTSMGGSWIAGQLYLIEKMGTGDDVKDNLKWYNLMGDPSLVIRTAKPVAYDVKQTLVKAPDSITVNVTATAAGKPLTGILASVTTTTGAPLATALTNAKGEASLKLPGVTQLAPTTVLTTTGYNVETVQTALH